MDKKKQLESVFEDPLGLGRKQVIVLIDSKKIQVTPKMGDTTPRMGDSVLTAEFLSEANKKEKKESQVLVSGPMNISPRNGDSL